MKQLGRLGLSALIGVVVASIYFLFEHGLHHALHFVWFDLVDTDEQRLWVPVICIVLTIVYFGTMHALDPQNEHRESHGLGETSKVSAANISKILVIGFLSLLAGASLGPEAVLVPACIMSGVFIGKLFLPGTDHDTKALGVVGFVALFTAFFSSFFVGVISLLLVKRQFKTRIEPTLIVYAITAAVTSYLTLKILENPSYVQLPDHSWSLNISTLFLLSILLGAGYAIVYLLDIAHTASQYVKRYLTDKAWWLHALVTGGVLSMLYLLGGNLVEFTGNLAIIPMFHQASALGLVGLVWIMVVKLLAISWSRAGGFRGGLIFPMIFVASIVVAIIHLYAPALNPIYGLIATIVGMFVADRKVKALI